MTQAKDGRERVSSWELAAFAAPAAPLLALTLPTVMFLPPHFHEHLGLSLGTVGLIFFGARVFDIVLDPTLGALQDHTRTRWGRRRPWILGATFPLMALVWLVFIGLGPGTTVWTAGAAVFVMYFVFAIMMVAHLGWAGEIIPTYHGRTRSLGAVQAASLIGQAVMLFLAGFVVQVMGGKDADAVAAMGWTLVVMLPLCSIVAVSFARERDAPPQQHIGLGEAFSTLIANKVVRRVLLPDLLLGIGQGVSGGLFLFYFQFILGFVQEAQMLAAIYFIAGLAGVPIWWFIGRKLGKHRALQIAFLYTAVTTSLLLILPKAAFVPAAIFMLVAGLAQGGCVLLTRALMADVVDDDEIRSGVRRSGLFLGLLLTTSKVGLVAGPAALFGLEFGGFVADLGAANTALALDTLRWMFIGIPVVMTVLGAISLRNYPLDETRQAELAAMIAAREAAAAKGEAVTENPA